ncbi:MAG: D-isomer specific 2-hydroxyacid dehydrogenase family protein [Leeuwenhoekiella sp.]
MDNAPKIAIVNSSTFGKHYPKLLARLKEIGSIESHQFSPEVSPEKLTEALKDVTYIVASVTPRFPKLLFEQNKKLLCIARHGIGVDNVDLEAATQAGVLVTRVPAEPERDAVAELSLALLMACLRDIVKGANASKALAWERRSGFVGWELSHLTVGVIGYGNIGSRVGEIIKDGFKTEVLAYDPNIANAVLAKAGVEPVELHELLRRSDVISLNASHNHHNFEMIGKKEIGLMKDGVIIVNTARGQLTDEKALAEAVKNGKIARLGVDVLQREPIFDDHPFLDLDNVIVLPHLGGYTDRSLHHMDQKNVEDIENVSSGKIPEEIANPDVLLTGTRAKLA